MYDNFKCVVNNAKTHIGCPKLIYRFGWFQPVAAPGTCPPKSQSFFFYSYKKITTNFTCYYTYLATIQYYRDDAKVSEGQRLPQLANLSKENGTKLVGYIFRMKTYVKIPHPHFPWIFQSWRRHRVQQWECSFHNFDTMKKADAKK